MAEALILRGFQTTKEVAIVAEYNIEAFNANTTWYPPSNIVGNEVRVILFGGNGGQLKVYSYMNTSNSVFISSGGSGYMNVSNIILNDLSTPVDIIIGSAGSEKNIVNSTFDKSPTSYYGTDGNPSYFGNYLSAAGGQGGKYNKGGDGGIGGSYIFGNEYYRSNNAMDKEGLQISGGKGYQFEGGYISGHKYGYTWDNVTLKGGDGGIWGGGGCVYVEGGEGSKSAQAGNGGTYGGGGGCVGVNSKSQGGNGGTYGGGGGVDTYAAANSIYGRGGTYGGNGGNYNTAAKNGTNTSTWTNTAKELANSSEIFSKTPNYAYLRGSGGNGGSNATDAKKAGGGGYGGVGYKSVSSTNTSNRRYAGGGGYGGQSNKNAIRHYGGSYGNGGYAGTGFYGNNAKCIIQYWTKV